MQTSGRPSISFLEVFVASPSCSLNPLTKQVRVRTGVPQHIWTSQNFFEKINQISVKFWVGFDLVWLFEFSLVDVWNWRHRKKRKKRKKMDDIVSSCATKNYTQYYFLKIILFLESIMIINKAVCRSGNCELPTGNTFFFFANQQTALAQPGRVIYYPYQCSSLNWISLRQKLADYRLSFL